MRGGDGDPGRHGAEQQRGRHLHDAKHRRGDHRSREESQPLKCPAATL
jgi:hypothetical protein